MQNLGLGGVGSPYVHTYRKRGDNSYNTKIKLFTFREGNWFRGTFKAFTTCEWTQEHFRELSSDGCVVWGVLVAWYFLS